MKSIDIWIIESDWNMILQKNARAVLRRKDIIDENDENQNSPIVSNSKWLVNFISLSGELKGTCETKLLIKNKKDNLIQDIDWNFKYFEDKVEKIRSFNKILENENDYFLFILNLDTLEKKGN